MQRAMARVIGFRGFLCTAIAVVCALGGRAAPAESLRLVTGLKEVPFEDLDDNKEPGFSVEVIRQVFASMGQSASFEAFPRNRSWTMVARGEADGIFSESRSSERERICAFPDEPLKQERWVFFIRTADAAKLKFSSFEDLIGHDVAVHGPVPGLFEQPTASPELSKFLREHHNMVETSGGSANFRLLAAGRVDYTVVNLSIGMRDIAILGLSGKIEPLLSSSVIEDGIYLCFSRARVPPSFVDAFSHALKEFKQTEAFQAIYRKYFP
jgi:polar amino acid transport system substrate-binding protein